MTTGDRVVKFPNSSNFLEAAQLVWTAVRIGEDPGDIVNFVRAESYLLEATTLPLEMQPTALQFLAKTKEANRRIAIKLEHELKYGPHDAFACWAMVISVALAGRSQADSFKLLAEFRLKAKASSESNLYKKANYRQLQDLWQKYKPVLHLAEAALIDGLEEDPELKELFQNVGIPIEPNGVETRSNQILESLRSQGRVVAPYVIRVG